jgi:hypothetical protein
LRGPDRVVVVGSFLGMTRRLEADLGAELAEGEPGVHGVGDGVVAESISGGEVSRIIGVVCWAGAVGWAAVSGSAVVMK